MIGANASVALIPNGAAEVRGGSGVGPGVGPGLGPGLGPGCGPCPTIISHWLGAALFIAKDSEHGSCLSSLPSDLLAGFAQGPQGPKAVPSADSIPSSRSSLTSVGRQMARDGWSAHARIR
jgi:hypothetical protein